ncbi:MAG: hypothetical protein ABIO24_08280, partial [Saprospiraceae bacterium]
LKILDIIEKDECRMGFPDTFEVFPFLTVDNEQVVLSLSPEKGIRLHFSDASSLGYRLNFLDKFIDYCAAWKNLLASNNGEQDENLNFADWWTLTVKTSIEVEKQKPLTGVGKIAN